MNLSRTVRSLLWAFTWGLGAAIGVAMGGWLTVVGGEASPGAESLDLVHDVLVLPVLAGLGVMALHLVGQALVSVARSVRASPSDGENNDGK